MATKTRMTRPAGSLGRCGIFSRGFTLIELLVVIAIIALLIGILLPALGKARDAARNVKDLSQVRGMGTAMLLYANDQNGWLPIMPLNASAERALKGSGGNPPFLQGQDVYGVAGLFSTFQIGVEARNDPSPSTNFVNYDYGYIGVSASGVGNYANGDRNNPFSSVPVMRGYLEGLEVLSSPAQRIDRYWAAPPTFVPKQNSRYENGEVKQVEVPQQEEDVVNYNVSYLYIAGLKDDEASVLFPPPFWGTETSTADVMGRAWWGYDWVNNRPGTNGEAQGVLDQVGFNPQTGYAEVDMFGDRGGNFVFTDGSATFVTENPQREFFMSADQIETLEERDGSFRQSSKSINLVNPNRSFTVQTIN